MKRIALLLVVLLIATGLVVAEDKETYGLSISGNATAKFGVDLDDNTFGFKNTPTTDLTVTFYPKASETNMGESEWYGEIKFKDIEIKLDDDATVTDDAGDEVASMVVMNVTLDYAKITNGSAYVKIYGAPADTLDYAPEIKYTDGAPFFGPFNTEGAAVRADIAAAGTISGDQGITIGYGSGMITDIALAFISAGDWEANANNDFGAKVTFDVKLVEDLVSLAGGAFYSAFDAGTIGFGISPKVTTGGITFDVGFDGQMPDGGDFVWEVDTNLTYDFDEDANTSVALGAYYTEDILDAKLIFTEKGDAGLADGLGTVLDLRLTDLMGTLGYQVGFSLDYTTNGLKPYTKVNYISDNDGTLGVSAGIEFGADFTGIDKTTLTLDWTANDLGDKVADTTDFDDNMGDVTIAAKVSF